MNWRDIAKFLGVAVQLALLVLLVRVFHLESRAFYHLFILALIGFLIHANLPHRFRLPFFLLLSLAGIGVVLGLPHAIWLIAIGLVLVGICHLPIAFGSRVALLLLVALLLVALRADLLSAPWSKAIWPILGSMFMFRLIIYLYELKHETEPAPLSTRLSYFFLLPNVAFPLFPVVDYRTFRRSHYDHDDEYRIYQTGVEWIFRGIIHLILYRAVYYYLSVSPAEVQSAGDLVAFMVTTYLLYLRISGHFHIIAGMLHLFGFNLPETHNLYYLASSFTDYWRRINIYWKDFMMKIFYYPSFFKLRRLGNTTALLLATLVVFVATMLLHSYQWFWIRGSFPLAGPDILFWSVLALLVMVNALYEAKKGRRRSLSGTAWGLRQLPGVALRTVGTFTVICVLWSLWNAGSIAEWVDLWSVLEPGKLTFEAAELWPVALVLVVSFATTSLGSASGDEEDQSETRGRRSWRLPAIRRPVFWTPVAILALYIFAQPAVLAQLDSDFSRLVRGLQENRLNKRDQALLERGYYEGLLGIDRFNTELWSLYNKMPTDWVSLWQTDAARSTDDLLRLELLPQVEIQFKGEALSTNRWGMRDREYALEKRPGTFRIAVLGSSPVMGSGVADNETFESLLEERLNRNAASDSGVRYELLNFAVDGYTLLQQVRVLERKVPRFQPDAVFYVAHETELEKTVGQLATLLSNRTEIPYPRLLDLARQAGVTPGMDRDIAARRLRPYGEEILRWGYQRIAEESAKRGVLTVWIFMPMPAVGQGAPCAQGSPSLCFGNINRAGEAADLDDPRVATLFRLAGEVGLRRLDLSGVYDGRDLSSLWTADWDRHPNAIAHELIADRLYETLVAERGVLAPAIVSGMDPSHNLSEGA